MRYVQRALIVFGVLTLLPARVEGQRIAGVVVDSAGRVIVDADVLVGTSLRGRTDSTGAFSLIVRERGTVRLRVRYIGFRPFETTIDPERPSSTSLRITLARMPQFLAEVRITDISSCERNTLRGFECRRNSGQGIFRDAGEIRSLRPSARSDMLDGIPTLRRAPADGPYDLDWRPAAPPSTCLREIYNGEDPNFDGGVRKVPEPLKRFALSTHAVATDAEATAAPTPMPSARGCALIVYWLREVPARARERRGTNSERIIIRKP